MSDRSGPRGGALARILRGFIPFLISPFLLVLTALSLALCDLIAALRPSSPPRNVQPDTTAVTVLIPNWNGRALLEKYLPSVVAAARRVPGSEILVVDNGSTDGTVAFLRAHLPAVRLLPPPTSLV